MCKNCFNGCLDPVSDKCVKYTGPDVPELGIENGISLFYVEEKLFEYLKSVIIGSGVFPTINEENLCELIQSNLPVCAECEGISLNDILNAILASVCALNETIQTTQETVNNLEENYTPNCLTGITGNEGTHAVLQALINKVCTIVTDVSNISSALSNDYVSVTDINTYIQNYLDNQSSSYVNSKMIPYVVMPYFGPLTYFDITGAGTGAWTKIYLCNGVNPGVPDLRGRTLVGATTMGSNPFSPVVDPAIAGNPMYALNTNYGTTQVTLGPTQIPGHTHVINTSVDITDPGHRHKFSDDGTNPTNTLRSNNDIIPFTTTPTNATISASGTGSGKIYQTSSEQLGLTIEVDSVAESTGGGLPHNNVQPSTGCYFIIYIP